MITPPKILIDQWRDFPALKEGLDFLRRNHAPRIKKDSPEHMMHDGISLQAYLEALDDVERILTTYPVKSPFNDTDKLDP